MPKSKYTIQKDGYYRYRETYRDVKLDITSKNADELEEKIRYKKNEIDKGLVLSNENMLVSTWAHTWLEEYKKFNVGEHHYNACKGFIDNHIIPEIGSKRLKDVRPLDIQKLLNKYADYSTSFMFHLKANINGIFRQAVINQYIAYNPASEVIPPKTKSGTHHCLTDKEREVFLEVCRTHHAGMWAKMMYYCGLRPQEVAPLLWSDIDVVNRQVHISKALNSTHKFVGETKTRNGNRSVPIPDVYFEELQAYRNGKADNELIFSTEPVYRNNGDVYLAGNKMLRYKAVTMRWNSIKNAMLIAMGARTERNKIKEEDRRLLREDFTPYDLRHTYCTDLMRAGVPINTAKFLMGHQDIRMITEIYGHNTSDQIENAAEKLNKLHSRNGQTST